MSVWQDTPGEIPGRDGPVRYKRFARRDGDALIGEGERDGKAVGLRLYHPSRAYDRSRTPAVEAKAQEPYRRGLGAFANLGEALCVADPAWVRVREVVFLEGTACWITDPPPMSIHERLAGQQRIPPDAVAALAQMLAGGLAALHPRALHLGLSPEAICLHNGAPVLANPQTDPRGFMRPYETQDGYVRLAYAAPEQCDGAMRSALTPATDVFAACAVLAELLLGRQPPDWAQRAAGAALPELSGVPPALAAAIRRGLALDPSERFASAGELREALSGIPADYDFWTREPSAPVGAAEKQTDAAGSAARPATPRPAAAATADAPRTIDRAAGAGGGLWRWGLATAVVVLAALGWWAYSAPSAYFANRPAIVRESRDPDSKVLGRLDRGDEIRAARAGVQEDIPWVKVAGGPYAGGYISARSVGRGLTPPELLTTFPAGDNATVILTGTVYERPDGSAKPRGTAMLGERYARVGVVANGMVEIRWPKGGVGYVYPSVFEVFDAELTAPPADASAPLPPAPERKAAPQPAPARSVPAPERKFILPPPATKAAPPPESRFKLPPPAPKAVPAPVSKTAPTGKAPSPPSAPASKPPPSRTPALEKLFRDVQRPPPSRPAPREPTVTPPTVPPVEDVTLPAPPPPPTIALPRWSRTPTATEIRSATSGARRGVAGRVRINCRVAASGRLEDCRPISETPANAGLLAAAILLLPSYQMERYDAEGLPTAGRRYTVPFTFRIASQ